MKEKPRDLIKCPQCGEMYSPSYSRCPFCEEDGEEPGKLRRGARRRTIDRHAGQSARGGLIVVLVLVLALLGWYLFGSDLYHNRNGKGDKTDTETVAPTDDSVPAIAPNHDEAEQPSDETPADETPTGETPADETPTEAPEETPTETADVSGAKLNRSDFTLSVKGEKYTIRLTGTEATPHWSIDNPNVATIAGDGTVTAVANGNTTVHCKVGNRDLTCVVRVRGTGSTAAPADAPMTAEPITPVAPPQPTTQTPATNQNTGTNTNTNTDANVDVSGAKLNRTDFTISRGEKFTMKLSGTTAAPRWDVDDPNVAVVNENGVVTGVGNGTTKLHCKVGDRDLTCIVRVR